MLLLIRGLDHHAPAWPLHVYSVGTVCRPITEASPCRSLRVLARSEVASSLLHQDCNQLRCRGGESSEKLRKAWRSHPNPITLPKSCLNIVSYIFWNIFVRSVNASSCPFYKSCCTQQRNQSIHSGTTAGDLPAKSIAHDQPRPPWQEGRSTSSSVSPGKGTSVLSHLRQSNQ